MIKRENSSIRDLGDFVLRTLCHPRHVHKVTFDVGVALQRQVGEGGAEQDVAVLNATVAWPLSPRSCSGHNCRAAPRLR